ncbi:tetratricopeptide repeat-containing protein [Skeletonema marinoi]|uniref:Tetratricopeptide repeat-containing protein n=1 Tax=Skeletonema marinoi TaxID=267567 RepID=A0AAD9DHM9_9STRA|nr:tetratricopeptide repeat-containing protein [Skeletonema marinoi]
MSSSDQAATNGSGGSSGNKEADDTREEWEIRRDELKATGDGHFRSKAYQPAIQTYADALQLDPTNHIILSNKSAAHLANGEKSKALHDARKCVKHSDGKWSKGHTRLAAAMMSLGRYGEAADAYSTVLNELDPNNEVAKRGLEDCRKKEQQLREEKERELRKMQEVLDQQKKAEKEAQEEKETETKNDNKVEKATEQPKPTKSTADNDSGEEPTNRIKTQMNDLGTSQSQIDRLLQVNYEWKNLNPFYVSALSLLVHPDKCLDDPVRAKTAFEQVRKAMNQMNDVDKRKHVRALIDEGMKQGKRDWKEECSKSSNVHPDNKEGLAQAQSKATMKIFAEIEQKRREIERRKRKFEQRERAQEDDEKKKETDERRFHNEWREGERVDKRVGNWRDFQVDGKKKRTS